MSNKNIILIGTIVRGLLVVFLAIATFCSFSLAYGLLTTIFKNGGFSNSSLTLRHWTWLLSPVFFGAFLYSVIKSNKKYKLKHLDKKP